MKLAHHIRRWWTRCVHLRHRVEQPIANRNNRRSAALLGCEVLADQQAILSLPNSRDPLASPQSFQQGDLAPRQRVLQLSHSLFGYLGVVQLQPREPRLQPREPRHRLEGLNPSVRHFGGPEVKRPEVGQPSEFFQPASVTPLPQQCIQPSIRYLCVYQIEFLETLESREFLEPSISHSAPEA